ncbi:MAG: MBL fold metallo-hydrolase [Betaproteobacteria bacterium]|nr:MBL fold metallo-hydrolase [Betaproteobacteria bacterium]
MSTQAGTRTRVDEIADGIHRISTPVLPPDFPGGFTFNQFLIVDDEPLLFHTGMNRIFPAVRDAVAGIIPLERLRYVSFSHGEADECGALNAFLGVAPNAIPLCSLVAGRSAIDYSLRPPRSMRHGERLSLGRHTVQWLDAPHVPHGWDCGYLFEELTRTLFCGDLFTQPGAEHAPLTEGDILASSEAMRSKMNYYALSRDTRKLLRQLADTRPALLACMHGSAWRGDGEQLLMALADALEGVSA